MRDDFRKKTKKTIGERSGYRCSNPYCQSPTIGPSIEKDKSILKGEAAHISAAAAGGPRYDESLTREERMGTDNGIWLCANCATLIDKDPLNYTKEKLRKWKEEAENASAEALKTGMIELNTAAQKQLKQIQIENITIDGAQLINDDFKERVKRKGEERRFRPADFYLAKREDDCQWYGIAKDWDIERESYDQIKKQTITSFNENRLSKISTGVYGRGGSGKSTLLRRLAWDLANEDFAVLWIKDSEINKFYGSGLSTIARNYLNKKFLIIIEDLYRIRQQTVHLKNIIDNICTYQNMRLVFGDREPASNIYREHIHNPDYNIFELSVSDNKQTLLKILVKIPEWKKVADLILVRDEAYQSTLYFILWTIGRSEEKINKVQTGVVNTVDLVSHFRALVESDLRVIAQHYPGLAKMLYYWASLYAKNKIYISFDLFLKLANLFKEKVDEESGHAFASSQLKPILDIYIHQAHGFIKTAGTISLITFNHDILPEDGLSRVKLENWQPFDDSIKLKMLPEIIEKGDSFSASNFFSNCLLTIDKKVFQDKEKRKWTDKLRAKDNYNNYLIRGFNDTFYNNKEKIELADEILSQEGFWNLSKEIVTMALNISKSKTKAEQILSQEEFWYLPKEIVTMALNISKNKTKAEQILSQEEFWYLSKEIVTTALNISKDRGKADKVLVEKDFWSLPESIVSMALNISKDKNKADEILAQKEFWNLPHQIVNAALNISKSKAKADQILSQKKFWHLPEGIVSTALNISNNKNKANEILAQKGFGNLPHQIVSTALNISNNKSKADEILAQKELWKLSYQIITTALNISNDKIKADEILAQKEFWILPHQIVSTALNISNNKSKADEILEQKEFWILPHQIVSTALNISNNKSKADEILEQKEFWKLSPEVVSTALSISHDKNKANGILEQMDFWDLPHQIVNAALNISENGQAKNRIMKICLERDDWRNNWNRTYHALNYFSSFESIPDSVKKIVGEVINEFSNKKNGDYFCYKNIMKIPFYTIPEWRKSSLMNIKQWERKKRDLVTNTILAYYLKPNEIRNMCSEILTNWYTEIHKEVMQNNGDLHYGDHVRLSFGHPGIKGLAHQTALQIKKAELKRQDTIPEPIMEVVNQIINDKEFPKWTNTLN